MDPPHVAFARYDMNVGSISTILLSDMKESTATSNTEKQPRFSIVIPTYQRPEGLRNCLSGIMAIEYERTEFEVIIVDDGSDADLAEVVQAFRGDLDLRLLYQDSNLGPAAARNHGAEKAKGDYLLFLDDDCIPCRNWLTTFDAHLDGKTNLAIGGNCTNGLSDSVFSEAQQMMMDYLYQYYNRDPEHAAFCATNNLAVPRQAFLHAGGFDSSFSRAAGEDREFSDRWIRSGAHMKFVTEAPVYHQHAMGLFEFIQLHSGYGRGARCFRSRQVSEEIKRGFEPAGFYIGLIVYPFSRFGAGKAFVLSLLQVLSQVAHTGGYLREMWSTR